MKLPSIAARAVPWLAVLMTLSPAVWAHGSSFALGDATSPAARGMALAMLGLILLVVSGVAALALYLRHKASHPSAVQNMLDHLQAENRRPGPETRDQEQQSPAQESWSRSPDWWKREKQ
ncbi:MAG TPA: hypothetical protein VMN36_12645 [Verrucomicrobiales bacterium]|nr:hypothetical protein [Verrucomicrobiales bacterium]